VDRASLQESRAKPDAADAKTAPAQETDRQQQLAELKESREQRQYKAATGLVKEALQIAEPDRQQNPMYRASNPTSQIRATARKGTDHISALLWAVAAAVGVQRALLVLFLADGGKWCWNVCQTLFTYLRNNRERMNYPEYLVNGGRPASLS
jgi:hypothetical protein